MHTLEVAGRLMFLSIADCPQRMLRFQRNPPQGITPESNGGVDEIAPILVLAIMQMRGMIERQTHAFERDQAIRKLVLDRLKLPDRLPELLSLLRIVDRQVESRSGRTLRPPDKGELAFEQPIVE